MSECFARTLESLTPVQLKALYPNLFARERPGILNFAAGWMPFLAQLCADIDEMLGAQYRDCVSWSVLGVMPCLGLAQFRLQVKDPLDANGDMLPLELAFEPKLAAHGCELVLCLLRLRC